MINFKEFEVIRTLLKLNEKDNGGDLASQVYDNVQYNATTCDYENRY